MSLQQTALKAYEKVIEKRDKEAQIDFNKTTASTRKQFIKTFNQEPDEVAGSRVTCEGLKFVRLDDYWMLFGECPRSHDEVRSTEIWNVTDLGRLLNEFEVNDSFHSRSSCDESWDFKVRMEDSRRYLDLRCGR